MVLHFPPICVRIGTDNHRCEAETGLEWSVTNETD